MGLTVGDYMAVSCPVQPHSYDWIKFEIRISKSETNEEQIEIGGKMS